VDLGDYLAAAAKKPWEPRVHDCCAFPALWAGIPLPEYSTEAEAEAMLIEAGGLVPLWDAAALGRAEALSSPDLAEPGDIGVIEMPALDDGVIAMVEIGAIWTGKRWAFVSGKGGVAASASAKCLKAWRPLRHE
jgi:hypothetical protein